MTLHHFLSELVNDMLASHLSHLTCHSELATVQGGDVDEIVEDKISGIWSVNSDDSRWLCWLKVVYGNN